MTYDPHAEVARLQMQVRKLSAQLEVAVRLLSEEGASEVAATEPPMDYRDFAFWREVLDCAMRSQPTTPFGVTIQHVRRVTTNAFNSESYEVVATVDHNPCLEVRIQAVYKPESFEIIGLDVNYDSYSASRTPVHALGSYNPISYI